MSAETIRRRIPFSAIVGQEDMKLALKLAYVQPGLSGVLLTGHRGTAKSTLVRAFAMAVYGQLPVTLPINATEDRVVGGWKIDELAEHQQWKEQAGLLEKANGEMLYIDEVNLLEDHIVDIILDVAASGIIEVQHEGQDKRRDARFTLVGTMNPEEGHLRPQLLDRFDLYVDVKTETELRSEILRRMLELDAAFQSIDRGESTPQTIKDFESKDEELKKQLDEASKRHTKIDDTILDLCVKLAEGLNVTGHRGERVLALAAQGLAAIDGKDEVKKEHLRRVAQMALRHRHDSDKGQGDWGGTQDKLVEEILG